MGRIGLVKVAVNFQKVACIRCPYFLGIKEKVVLVLVFCCWYSFWCDVISLFVVCIYLIFGAMFVVFWSCGFTNQQMMVFVFVVLVAVAVDAVVFPWRESSELVGSVQCFLWGGSSIPKQRDPAKIQNKLDSDSGKHQSLEASFTHAPRNPQDHLEVKLYENLKVFWGKPPRESTKDAGKYHPWPLSFERQPS